MKIVGFLHVAKLNHWRDVFRSQLGKLRRFGLYDATAVIHVTVLGTDDDGDLVNDPKFVLHRLDDISAYEFPTLERLYRVSTEEDCLLWYMHGKGVSHPLERERMEDWREFMEYFAIERYPLCLRALEVSDLCGVNWTTRRAPHFSGNFWWARSDYIRTLPSPATLDQSDRWQAEWWVGSNPSARVVCFSDSGVDHYKRGFPRSMYASDDASLGVAEQ
jgi:hypothetical protein